MFRVHGSDDAPVGPVAEPVILLTVLVALGVSIALLVLEGLEDRFLSLVIALALAACAAALARFRRRYVAAQQTLRRVKMLAHDILASMDKGVITIDGQGSVTSINSAAIRLLGVDFECVGESLAQISREELPLVELARELLDGQTPILDRDFAIAREGRCLRYRADAQFLKDIEGITLGAVLSLRDVTERALMEERMARMERFISLGSLASGLHHEIKNPLTALSLHVQLLDEQLHHNSPSGSIDELLGVLKTEIHRLNGVLESFRNFANLQRLSIQPTDVLEVLENAIRLIRPQATEQRVQIALLHPAADLPRAPLDVHKFEQAILNLLINALEAMPDGGLLSVGITAQKGSLTVAVTDTGSGVSPELRPSLFKPYFSTKSKGTGMGLALSEKLIGQHGGRIDYETGERGTTFQITLPMETDDDDR